MNKLAQMAAMKENFGSNHVKSLVFLTSNDHTCDKVLTKVSRDNFLGFFLTLNLPVLTGCGRTKSNFREN
jgi:hypothetical protein